jgi:hypothetical protein
MHSMTQLRNSRFSLAMLMIVGMLAGCGRGKETVQGGEYESARAYLGLGGTGIDRVLGMEAPTTDWKILYNAPGTIGFSTSVTQGSASLSLRPRGNVPIQSAQLAQLGSRVGTSFMVDIQFQGTHANAWWWGVLTIGVDIPSLGVSSNNNGLIVNSFDLTNKIASGWKTLTFGVPAALRTLLADNYDDLQFTITINVPANSTGTYLLDNLRFLGGSSPPPTNGGSVTECMRNWRDTICGEWCTRETQEDRKHCTLFLDCYFESDTGPSSDPDGRCGVNRFTYGMAPKTIADQVYQCLACPGTTPVTSCANPVLPNGTPCTDNDLCTSNDRCQSGVCRGEAVVCGDSCNGSGICDPLTGRCVPPPPPSHLLVHVLSGSSGFSVVNTRKIEAPFQKPRGIGAASDWSYRALSAQGAVLVANFMHDPHVVTGTFANPITGESEGVPTRSPSASFLLRVPGGAKTVQFFAGNGAYSGAGQMIGSLTITQQ